MMELVRSKEFAWLFLLFLSLTSVTAWVVANPPMQDQFASISVLGTDMTATNYFPAGNSTITPQEAVQWNVFVYNHLGTAQLFLLTMKLANQTISGPSSPTNTPNAGKILMQTYRAVLIDSVNVNGQLTNGTMISANGGQNFRIVLELEAYDFQTGSFIFSFRSNGTVRSVWDQIWFSLK